MYSFPCAVCGGVTCRFLRNFLPSAVTKVSNVALKKFLTFDTPELQRVLLVTKKKLSPMPYDRLSLQFDRRAGACQCCAADGRTRCAAWSPCVLGRWRLLMWLWVHRFAPTSFARYLCALWPATLTWCALHARPCAVFGYASPSDEKLMAKLGLDVDEVPALFVSPGGGATLDPNAENFADWTRCVVPVPPGGATPQAR